METIFILLCVLIILSIFNVGESFYKIIGLKNYMISGLLLIILMCTFLPYFKIDNIGITISGVIIPFLFCLKYLNEFNSKKTILSFFASLLVLTTFVMIMNLANTSVVNDSIYVTIIFSVIMAILSFAITKNSKISFLSLFLGLNIGNLLYFLIKYYDVTENILLLGSNEILLFMILSYIFVIFFDIFYEKYKNKKRINQNIIDEKLIEK